MNFSKKTPHLKRFILLLLYVMQLIIFSVESFANTVMEKRLSPDWKSRPGDVIILGQAFQDVTYTFNIKEEYEQYINKFNLTGGHSNLVTHEIINELSKNLKPQEISPGGSANNTAAGLINSDINVLFYGSVANDIAGQSYKKYLQQYNIKSMISTYEVGATGTIAILVAPDGERTMLVNPGVSKKIDHHVDNNTLKKYKLAFTEGYLLDDTDENKPLIFLMSAKLSGMITAFTFGDSYIIKKYHKKCQEIIKQSELVFADKQQMEEFFQTSDWESINKQIKSINSVFIVTDGANGADIFYQDSAFHIAAHQVHNVVDTTGAGDQFASGFLSSFINGKSLEEAAKTGNKKASEIIQIIGGKPIINSNLAKNEAFY